MHSSNVWWTADLHFNHANVIKYTNRPFSDVQDMNEQLILRWNTKVRPNDFVFCVGDFGFGSKQSLMQIFARLNGQKCLIKGNHDKEATRLPWQWVKDYHEVDLEDFDKKIVMSHYAMRVWNKSHHGSLMLYGHSHGNLPGNSQSLDVGVDVWDYAPCNLTDILSRMAELPRFRSEDFIAD